MKREELIKEVAKIVSEHWRIENNALYIADIPTKIREAKGVDYKEIIGDERLKSFALDTEGADSYKVITHPRQKAKIGLVPYGVEFSFQEEPEDDNQKMTHNISRNSRETTLSFLELIDNLPSQEKTSIQIPAHIIAKLISKK